MLLIFLIALIIGSIILISLKLIFSENFINKNKFKKCSVCSSMKNTKLQNIINK